MGLFVGVARVRLVRLCALAFFFSPSQYVALTQSKPAADTTVTAGYVRALERANQFLMCWSMRDQQCGVAMASPALKKAFGGDQPFREYMSGLSTPHHLSFEIEHGRELAPGRIAFPVRLYEDVSSSPDTEKQAVP